MVSVWRIAGLFLALSVFSIVLFDAAVATWGRERSYDVTFWSDGAISQSGQETVAKIARTLTRDSEFRAKLRGYAPAGTDALAAKRRAAADTASVREELISRGVPEDRIALLAPVAYSNARPVTNSGTASSDGGDSGAPARRVEVVIAK